MMKRYKILTISLIENNTLNIDILYYLTYSTMDCKQKIFMPDMNRTNFTSQYS